MLEQLHELKPTAAAGDAHLALTTAARLFDREQKRVRTMFLLSDMQESDWRQGDWPQPQMPVGTLLARLVLADHASRTSYLPASRSLTR